MPGPPRLSYAVGRLDRVMRTELTRAGARVLAACDRAVDELERRMLGDLDGKTADDLCDSLLRLARVLEQAGAARAE